MLFVVSLLLKCLLFCLLNINSQILLRFPEIQVAFSELLSLVVSTPAVSETSLFVMWEVDDIFSFLLIIIHYTILVVFWAG